MKKSRIKEIRAKTEKELQKMLSDEKKDLARIYIELKGKKLRNTALLANKKRMIAVVSTLLREKELIKL